MMQKLPIGIQDFPTIRNDDYLYVDKTAYMHEMITQGQTYFLSRPRRFGKSLLISTLDCIFQGKRELFKGLAIDQLDYDWQIYPVIRLDMSKMNCSSLVGFENSLKAYFSGVSKQYDLPVINFEQSIIDVLNSTIEALAQNSATKKIIVLIDEYDKPLLDHIEDEEKLIELKDFLRDFYGIFKAQSEYIRFIFLTGVTRFAKVSVFSGLNNLEDISFNQNTSAILGYTEVELFQYFHDQIIALSFSQQQSKEAVIAKIKQWYNGYLFSEQGESVYNPFSTLLLFKQKEFKPHWFETATPTFLYQLIRKQQYNIKRLDALELTTQDFSTFEVENPNLLSLLYQAGYFTIKGYDEQWQLYHLDYPNYEVKQGFLNGLIGDLTQKSTDINDVVKMSKSLQQQDVESFFQHCQRFFAGIPYDIQINAEKYYQSIFYVLFKLIGMQIQAEYKTNIGRIDAIIILAEIVYIFEFKLDQSAEIALQQIKDKGYADGFKDKKVMMIGANFSTIEKNISQWLIESS